MSKTPITERREWSFLPYRKDRDEATGLVHDLPPVVVEDGIGVIASCGFGGPDHDNVAFARLMAAAPDLLKFAIAAKDYLQHPDGHHLPAGTWFKLNEQVRAAIVKAMGDAA